MSDLEFNLYYSIYSFPNIVLPVFGGYFIDVIGNRIGAVLFSVFVVLGQAIFAFGVMVRNYPISLLGRGVFGLGGENLTVCSNHFVTSWFTGSELAMAIGTLTSIGRLGTVLNNTIEPAIVESTGSLSLGLWIGCLFCIFSLICVVSINIIDKKKDKNLGIISKKLLPESEKFKFKELKYFGCTFWYLCLNCLSVYIGVSCFNNIASNYFQERFHYTSIEAGSIISITYLVAAILSPVFGILVDKVGRRVHFMMLSALLITSVHIAFLVTPESYQPLYPIFYMVFLGIGYSIYSAVMWASIPYIVRPKVHGTAFGSATAVMNFGLAIGPLIIGYIQETTHKDRGYYWVSFFFVIVGVLGMTSCVMVYVYDLRKGGVLLSKCPGKAKDSFLTSEGEENTVMMSEKSSINK